MKIGFRRSPASLILLSWLLSAFFVLASSTILAPWGGSSAKADNIERQLINLRTQINLLIKKRTFAPALSKVKRYVRLTARKYGQRHDRYASALDLQARIYLHLNRQAEATRYAARAAAIRKKNRDFKAERKAYLKSKRAAMKKRKAELRLQMLRERASRQRKKKKTTAAAKPVPGAATPATRPKTAPRREVRTMRQKAAPTHARRKRRAGSSTAAADARAKGNFVGGVIRGLDLGTGKQRPAVTSRTRKSRAVTKPPIAMPAPVAPPAPITEHFDQSPGTETPAASIAPPEPMMAEAEPEPVLAPTSAAPVPIGKTAKNKNHTIVKVYYATDRQRTASLKLSSFFGGTPSEPKRISYGICEVSIPKGHKSGQLEAPSIWRFEFKENPDRHVVLLNVFPQEKKSYFRNLKNVIARSKGENAFIFIHGYNVTFMDAARRTAQISYDLRFDGAPIFYSWPSTGELSGYPTDEDNILWAQENVKQFLKDFVEKTDAKNIYLIAHSMGSRALTSAVASLISEAPEFKKRFKEIILAAPDISARVFRDNIAPKMIEASSNVTLYVSADDKALQASRKFHSNPRAGEAGEKMILMEGIDTIDATGIDASLLAHSYFAEAKSIISDIWSIFRGKRPSVRKSLKQVKTKRGNYWIFAIQ